MKELETLIFNGVKIKVSDYFFNEDEPFEILDIEKGSTLPENKNCKFWSDKHSLRARSLFKGERVFYEKDVTNLKIYEKDVFEKNYGEYLI